MTTDQPTVFTRSALQQAYSQWASDRIPTVLLTLTVKEPQLKLHGDDGRWQVSDRALLRKANYLLYWVNVELFGRKYQKSNNGLTGFGCIERQTNNQPHLHLALDNRLSPKRIAELKRVIFEKAEKIPLFQKKGIDFRLIEGSSEDYRRVGNYLAKEGRMLTLGTDGLY